MKILLGLFLIAHGLIHASYFTPKPNDPNYPFDFSIGWFTGLVGSNAKYVGIVLAVVTIVSFVLAGLGVLGVPGLAAITNQLAIVGAAASLVLLVLFWHMWLIVGVLINVVLLFGILRLGWQLGSL